MLSKKLLLSVGVACILALSASAFAGDWGIRFSYGSGRCYPAYSRSYVYYDRTPVVVYGDYAPDVVVYDPPPVVAYDRPRVYYSSYYPRTVVYRDYAPAVRASVYYSSGYDRVYRSYRPSYSYRYYDRGHDRGATIRANVRWRR